MPSPECQPCHNCRWSHEETSLLIKLWLRDDGHQRFNGTSRDCLVYTEMVDSLKASGFQKTAQQVRLKIKNLKKKYKSALSKRRASGGRAKLTFRYFNELDKLLRRSPPTVSTPTVIYMDQEIASAQSSDEESADCHSAVPVTTKSDDTANSDHALYAAKADGKDEDDLPSLGIKKTTENKTRLNTMEEILSRVLDTALDKFMKFEKQIEEKNREETNSFRNEVLALERKKLEESVTQTLQNDRLICLMESLVSNPP